MSDPTAGQCCPGHGTMAHVRGCVNHPETTDPTAGERETTAEVLTELEDWGRLLLAEHERRICDVHGPAVPSKNTGQSIVRYAERLRDAVEQDNIEKSLTGETPWDNAVRRVSRPGYDFRGRPIRTPATPDRTKPTAATLLASLAATRAADEKAREKRLPWGAP